jgi:hypothetical protein
MYLRQKKKGNPRENESFYNKNAGTLKSLKYKIMQHNSNNNNNHEHRARYYISNKSQFKWLMKFKIQNSKNLGNAGEKHHYQFGRST